MTAASLDFSSLAAGSHQVSLKAEYPYIDPGKESFDPEGPNEVTTFIFVNEYHLIRRGANRHF